MQKITENIYIGAQLTADDMERLKQLNINTIICNRPDNEIPAEINFEKIKIAAEKENIAIYYIPISTRENIKENIETCVKILIDSKPNIFAYCRSGTRSKLLLEAALAKMTTTQNNY
ncbi:beta-lactamase hydrolase domain-containing protein [Bartonella sp. DGB1]|uniref:beta-lactamase hydrolase domain-containing protein n=1 Tax=Bartonella sp. DGB1 TaxID=3239807 RepID=UPI003523BE83